MIEPLLKEGGGGRGGFDGSDEWRRVVLCSNICSELEGKTSKKEEEAMVIEVSGEQLLFAQMFA